MIEIQKSIMLDVEHFLFSTQICSKSRPPAEEIFPRRQSQQSLLVPSLKSSLGCWPLQLPDVLNHRLAETIDMRPPAVAHPVAVAGYIDHVTPPPRVSDRVVGLLVGNH